MLGQLLEVVTSFVLSFIERLGYFGVFILTALGSANIPIPSEVIIPFSGFLVAENSFNFWLVVLIGSFGELTGATFSYLIANRIDKRFKKIREKKEYIIVEKWFKRFGEFSIFIGRLVPVVRTFISFPAGLFKIRLWRFMMMTFIGSFVWIFSLAYIGFFLGERWNIIEPYFRKFDFVIAMALGLGFIWWLWHHFKKT
jgi:membrane protein DedA with SNARE-associated domain